jgi:hypothetical protein
MVCGMSETPNQPDERGWTADDSTFGARLALIRQHMGWGNVKEAATACGVPAETWRTWERDGVMPRNYTEICDRIAQVTGADFIWLLTGNRTPSTSTPFPTMSAVLTSPLGGNRVVGRAAVPTKPTISLNPFAAA